jgi:hypothetical protein
MPAEWVSGNWSALLEKRFESLRVYTLWCLNPEQRVLLSEK